jgi:hypothetical protein
MSAFLKAKSNSEKLDVASGLLVRSEEQSQLIRRPIHAVKEARYRTGSGSMKGRSRKKFLLSAKKFLAASHATHPKLLNAHHNALVDRFLLALVEPDLNSRCRGQC